MTSASHTDAASARPLRMRARQDLAAEPIEFRSGRYWSVKDPVALRYFQLREEEMFVLRQLDGQRSADDVIENFAKRFAPNRLSATQLQSFLGMLHREGLITADERGQGEPLLERAKRRRSRERLAKLTNVLAIRFRGIDPEPLLRATYPLVRCLITWPMFLLGWLLIAAALGLLWLEFDQVTSRLPGLTAFFSAGNVVWLAVTLACAKILHELAHAYTCKRFGGNCHELGVMFLVFTPCLYCNVSDAWLLPSKWQRIAISAAGMYVELVLAAICTFGWWYSEPGLLNAICLNVMVVCSISTVLFNGNPLLRYDGYFILADWLEIPNLREQATSLLRHIASRFCLGVELGANWLVPRRDRVLLATYGVASLIYRWVLVFAILWLCHTVLRPYGLEIVVRGLAVLVVGSMVAIPCYQLVKWTTTPSWGRGLSLLRLMGTASIIVAVVYAAFAVPLPHYVIAPAWIEADDARHIYVRTPGLLAASVAVGDVVSQGDILAELVDREIAHEVARLMGQRDQQQLHVESLRKLQLLDRGDDPGSAAGRLPTATEALATVESQLAELTKEQERLTIRAPRSGTVLPTPLRAKDHDGDGLRQWTGMPLDPENRGCYLQRETVLCTIGNPDNTVAMAIVAQSDIRDVRVGDQAVLYLTEMPNVCLRGLITEIAESDLDTPPRELAAKELLPTDPQSRSPELLDVYYRVSIELTPGQPTPALRTSGRARIHVGERTAAERIYRYLCRTFRIDLQ